MINHVCHMGGRYLETMIPGRMEMYWGSVLICATYMGMFWGITLWLAVCVRSVAWVQAALDPQWGAKTFWIRELNEELCMWSTGQGLPTLWSGHKELLVMSTEDHYPT